MCVADVCSADKEAPRASSSEPAVAGGGIERSPLKGYVTESLAAQAGVPATAECQSESISSVVTSMSTGSEPFQLTAGFVTGGLAFERWKDEFTGLTPEADRGEAVRGDSTLDTYSVLECVSGDESIRDWFLRLVPSLSEGLAVVDSLQGLQELVERIAELFRLIDRDAHRSLAGLWGELVLITASDEPSAAVSAWHVDDRATHDFTSEGIHVEVKTSEAGRKHHFAPRQLQPGSEVLIASLLLEQSDDGASVMDLYAEVLELLPDDFELQQKVHELVIACVGRRLSTAEDVRFDVPGAIGGLRLVLGEAIPQLREPFPAGVSDVRFVSDLTAAEQVSPSEVSRRPLWANLGASYVRRTREVS